MQKQIIAILASLFTHLCCFAQSQFQLNVGDVVTYRFATLPFVGNFSDSPQNRGTSAGQVTVFLQTLSAGQSFRYEMFENDETTAPFYSATISSPSPTTQGYFVPNVWQDLNGTIRLTGLSGSLLFNQITVGVRLPIEQSPGGRYDLYSTIITIPEPKTLSLGMIGCGALCLLIRKKAVKKQNFHQTTAG